MPPFSVRYRILAKLCLLVAATAQPATAVFADEKPLDKKLTVGVVSSTSVFGDVQGNLAHFEKLVQEAKAAGARLVCFPELSLVGYSSHADILKSAQPVPGPATDRLAAIARQHNVYISAGIAERDGTQHHITQVLVGPEGYLGKYRKCFPTGTERACGFAPGEEYPTWEIDGFRFGIIICADGRQEKTLQAMKAAGADIVHHPHGNFVGGLGRDSEEWTRAKLVYVGPRATQARAFMLVNNSAGDIAQPDGAKQFGAGAMVIDPLGQAIARTEQRDRAERMVVATLAHPLSLIPPSELGWLTAGDADLQARVERHRAPVNVPREATSRVIRHDDLVYGRVLGAALAADVAYPRAAEPMPAIISVHGGRWKTGHKRDKSTIDVDQWARLGFFAMSIDYRLRDATMPPACYQDFQCAIRFVHAHAEKYNIDENRVFLIGQSAGGQMVSLAATLGDGPYPRTGGWEQARNDFLAAISVAAAYDLPSLDWADLWTPPGIDQMEARKLASPNLHLSKDSRPLLIIHADNDRSVPIANALVMVEALEKSGAPHKFLRYTDAGHMGITDEVVARSLEFIKAQGGLR